MLPGLLYRVTRLPSPSGRINLSSLPVHLCTGRNEGALAWLSAFACCQCPNTFLVWCSMQLWRHPRTAGTRLRGAADAHRRAGPPRGAHWILSGCFKKPTACSPRLRKRLALHIMHSYKAGNISHRKWAAVLAEAGDTYAQPSVIHSPSQRRRLILTRLARLSPASSLPRLCLSRQEASRKSAPCNLAAKPGGPVPCVH